MYFGCKSYLGSSKGSVADSQDAIRPFVGNRVKLAIQLPHSDGLGIDNRDLDLVLIHQTLVSQPHACKHLTDTKNTQRYLIVKKRVAYVCAHTHP